MPKRRGRAPRSYNDDDDDDDDRQQSEVSFSLTISGANEQNEQTDQRSRARNVDDPPMPHPGLASPRLDSLATPRPLPQKYIPSTFQDGREEFRLQGCGMEGEGEVEVELGD
jgi:hypothetical protein